MGALCQGRNLIAACANITENTVLMILIKAASADDHDVTVTHWI